MSKDPFSRMEPDTVADNDDGHCLHSIAISLKRIADNLQLITGKAVDGDGLNVNSRTFHP